MREEHAERDAVDHAVRIVQEAQLGEVARDPVVERELPAVAQLHDRDRRERLGDRPPVVDGPVGGGHVRGAVLLAHVDARQDPALAHHERARADDPVGGGVGAEVAGEGVPAGGRGGRRLRIGRHICQAHGDDRERDAQAFDGDCHWRQDAVTTIRVASASGLVDPPSPSHRPLDRHIHDLDRWHGARVAPQHHEVRPLARRERPLLVLLERGIGAIDREHLERLVEGDALVRAPDGAADVGAGDHRGERHHRLEGARRVVAPHRGGDPRVDEPAHREHPFGPLGAVLGHLLSVEVDVAREGCRDAAERLDAADQLRGEHRAVLEPEARVAARVLTLQALIERRGDVDPDLAVGVRADLPSGAVRLLEDRPEHLGAVHHDAVVVRTADVGFGEARGALGDGAIRHALHGADLHPLVAEAGADAGGHHLVEVGREHVAVDARAELPRVTRILVGAEALVGAADG